MAIPSRTESKISKLIKKVFPDEDIRRSIFGEDNLDNALNEPKKIVKCINNILYLTTGYFYSKFLNWRSGNLHEMPSIGDVSDHYRNIANSALRVLYIMDELYYKYSVNTDVVSYLMINTQINIAQRSAQDYSLDEILEIPTTLDIERKDDNTFLSKFTSEYSKIETNTRYIPQITKEHLVDFLRHFSFYETVRFEIAEDGNVSFIKIDHLTEEELERIDSKHTVICRNGMLYLLTDIQRFENAGDDDSLRLTYRSIFDRTALFLNVGGEDSAFDMTGTDFFMGVTAGMDLPDNYSLELFFRGLNTGSYKYINRLAMAIVDSIYGRPDGLVWTVKLIKQHMGELNLEELDPDLLYKIDLTQKADLDESLKNLNDTDFSVNEIKWSSSKKWDDIMVRLLIIMSPREVIATYVEECGIFDDFLQQICYRFDNLVDIPAIEKEKDNEMALAKRELILLNFGQMGIDENQITKWVNKTNAMIGSKLIVHALSKLTSSSYEETQSENKESVGGSIYPRILLLEDIIRRMNAGDSVDPTYIINRSDFILRQTLKTTVCTYHSLLASIDKWSDYEINSYGSFLDLGKINDYKTEIQNAFIAELKRSVSRYQGWSSEKLIEEIIRISIESYDNERCVVTDKGTGYYIMTGRTSLIDVNEVKKVLTVMKGRPLIRNPNDPDELLEFEDVRKECLNGGPLSKRYAKYYLNMAYDVLRIIGGCYNKDAFNDLTQKSAFPFVGTYVDNRRNMDGHNICNFAIRNDIGGTTKVHILSEMEYELNKKYYIIPNLRRTDREWWIQPFMIECGEFNNIMTEGLNREQKRDMTSDEKKFK